MKSEFAILLFALPGVTVAQVISSEADYDAWKSSHARSQMVARNAPMSVEAQSGERGGGGADSCSCWIEPDASFITLDNDSDWVNAGFLSADDGSFGPIDLPFSFELFGESYTSAYINLNGNLSFTEPFAAYTASGFPSTYYRMVAPFWGDVDLRGDHPDSNLVQYKLTPTALIVSWTRVGYYYFSMDKVNTFSVVITDGLDPILPEGQNVGFCFKDMQWTTGDASLGVDGFEGDPATVGVNKGDGVSYALIGRFNLDSTAYDGPFGANDGVNWLDDSGFRLSTAGVAVPPILGNTYACDTLVVQVGESLEALLYVLAGTPGQTVSATVSAPSMSSLQIGPITPGDYVPVALTIAPTSDEVGWNTLIVDAFTLNAPVLTTTSQIVVQVIDDATTSSAGEEAGQWGVYPNPVSSGFTVRRMDGQAGTLRVFDAQGRMVVSRRIQTGERTIRFDAAALENGYYWIALDTGNAFSGMARMVVAH